MTDLNGVNDFGIKTEEANAQKLTQIKGQISNYAPISTMDEHILQEFIFASDQIRSFSEVKQKLGVDTLKTANDIIGGILKKVIEKNTTLTTTSTGKLDKDIPIDYELRFVPPTIDNPQIESYIESVNKEALLNEKIPHFLSYNGNEMIDMEELEKICGSYGIVYGSHKIESGSVIITFLSTYNVMIEKMNQARLQHSQTPVDTSARVVEGNNQYNGGVK